MADGTGTCTGTETGEATASSKTLLALPSESDSDDSIETLVAAADQPLVLVAALADRVGLAGLALEGMFLLL